MGSNMTGDVYDLISDEETYIPEMEKLKKLYVKKKNTVYARHQLSTRKQLPGENIRNFSQALLSLPKDCIFKTVTTELHKQGAVRDAFISGVTTYGRLF